MRIRSAGIALLVLGLAPSAGAQTRLKACEELSDLAIPASEIGLPTSGVTVTVARHPADAPPRQDADGGSAQDEPEQCNDQDRSDPSIPRPPRSP